MISSDNTTLDIEVRRQIYDSIMRDGRIPLAAEVAAALNRPLSDIQAAFGRMSDAHVLVLQDSGEILMANPFSSVPTPFIVEASGKQYWGNCIWDALGVLAMLHADGRVVTSCADCNEAMMVEVQGGNLIAELSALAHFAVPAAHWWDNIRFT